MRIVRFRYRVEFTPFPFDVNDQQVRQILIKLGFGNLFWIIEEATLPAST
jgi:hypothetical protein